MRLIIIGLIITFLQPGFSCSSGAGDNEPVSGYTPVSPELFNKISTLDSLMFAAYNAHDLDLMMNYMSDSLEFFHDTGGVSGYLETRNGLKSVFESASDIRRDLVPGSLEVYPIKDYGAIQTGLHTFCHTENGKPDCGTFKFLHIWRKKDGVWKITRVISYDHKAG